MEGSGKQHNGSLTSKGNNEKKNNKSVHYFLSPMGQRLFVLRAGCYKMKKL